MTDGVDDRPPVRTFKPRRRPMSAARSELFERLQPVWGIDEIGEPFDQVEEFGRMAALVLDIGIGAGESLTTAAHAEPGTDHIGADVHTPGIAATLERIESIGLTNVRVLHGDAMVFVSRLPHGSLSGVRIYFPDPWPKERHRHRRITSTANVDRFVELLRPGGTLHVATDIAEYVRHTRSVCDAHPCLDGGVVTRPDWRAVTRYERKGLAAGRTVTDLIYRRL